MSELIQVDTTFFDCSTINLETFLAKVGTEITDTFTEAYDPTGELPHWGNDYDIDEINRVTAAEFPELPAGLVSHVRDNIYNAENDFDQNFVWEVFAPESADWCYGTVLVAINISHGGDPRGSYAGARWFIVEDCVESSFLEWTLSVHPVTASGDSADENGEFTSGYTSRPVYAFESAANVVGFSEKRGAWLAWLNGRAVAVHFSHDAEWL